MTNCDGRGCGWVRILGVCLGLVSTGRASAAERRVPADYGTIQAAINASVTGDEVVIAPGTYRGDGNRDLDLLGKAITVRSQDPNDWGVVQATVINCQGTASEQHRGFYIHTGEGRDSRVLGLTIRNGFGDAGGGILCESTSPTIDRCRIVDNQAAYAGGGLAISSGSPSISRCVISDNSLVSNYQSYGGGVCCGSSNSLIADCLISGNSTAETYSSSALNGGGGVELTSSRDQIVNCTIIGNRSYGFGGGIHGQSRGSVTNCIIWGNRGSQAEYDQIVGSISVTYSDVQGGQTGEGNINVDPCFSPFYGNYQLTAGSPCIDAGTAEPNAGLSNVDIDGCPRSVDGNGDGVVRPDMGAYERPGSGPLLLAHTREVCIASPLGGPKPSPETVVVVNDGVDAVPCVVTTACSWLQATPSSGVSAGQVLPITLSADPTGLPVGDHWCRVSIADPNTTRAPLLIGVLLRVRPVRCVPSEYPTIQAAIDAAQDYEFIRVAEGTHRGPGNRDLDLAGKAIIIRGENGADRTIIDCQGAGRGFNFHQRERADTIIEDLSITNGSAEWAGAIRFDNSSPTIRRCIISGNSAVDAGGIGCEQSMPSIEACVIRANSASNYGGGIEVRDSVRYRFPYTYYGASGPVFRGCQIVGNTASKLGGGVYAFESVANFEGCTIVANKAGQNGGGIVTAAGSGVCVTNCIVWGNDAPAGRQIAQDLEFQGGMDLRYSDVEGGPNAFNRELPPPSWFLALNWNEGCIDSDPLFNDPYGPDGDANTWQDNDYHLSVYSPCKNAGDPNGDYAGQTDIDGEARRMGGRVDMGADERSYFWVECGSGGGEALGLLAMMGMWFVRRRS